MKKTVLCSFCTKRIWYGCFKEIFKYVYSVLLLHKIPVVIQHVYIYANQI